MANTSLANTVSLMNSDDYQDRFKAEYVQLKIRTDGLAKMLANWDQGTLAFTPKSPRGVYDKQLSTMKDYLAALESRAADESIDLSAI